MKSKTLPDSKSTQKEQKSIREISHIGIALSTSETVNRFGNAAAEYIKGYAGVDNETGQKLSKGLAEVSKYRLNEDAIEAQKNIKQQAGFSAEIAATSRDNADAIIAKSRVRASRSDDLTAYGKNHNVVDRVKLLDGHIIEGSQSQMKFVGNPEKLLHHIASEDGKFSRYRGLKLELPTEQCDAARQYCKNQAAILHTNANHAELNGKINAAEKLKKEAANYDALEIQIQDSGLTAEQAIFYRTHPKIATLLDITRTSHNAGLEGAKFGAIIGSVISLVKNIFLLAQNEKNMVDAAENLVVDTSKAAAIGYGTAFVGSALKSGMQQSNGEFIRAISKTNAPTLVLNICFSLASTIKRFAQGEITEAQMLAEIGEKGAGMLSSGMMAALGQLVLPIPFVGAAIGGMIGYTLSSLFYQAAADTSNDLEISRARLKRTIEIQKSARELITAEQLELDHFLAQEIPKLRQETHSLLSTIILKKGNIDLFAESINTYATLLGQHLQFHSLKDFENFMHTNQTLKF